jgi:hypothetical protein
MTFLINIQNSQPRIVGKTREKSGVLAQKTPDYQP